MTRPKLSAAACMAFFPRSSSVPVGIGIGIPSATPRSFTCSRLVFSSRRAKARAYAAAVSVSVSVSSPGDASRSATPFVTFLRNVFTPNASNETSDASFVNAEWLNAPPAAFRSARRNARSGSSDPGDPTGESALGSSAATLSSRRSGIGTPGASVSSKGSCARPCVALCTNASGTSSRDERRFTFRNRRRRRAAAPVHAAANPAPGGARGCAGSACPESATARTSTEGAARRRCFCFCFVRAGASESFFLSSLNEDEARASARADAGSLGSLASRKTRARTISMIGAATV